MFVAIISSLFFLAVAGLLRSEPMRNLPLMLPISFYFFAEAAWTLLSGILLLCGRDAAGWAAVGHYVLMAVAAGYIFYCGCGVYQAHKKDSDGSELPHREHHRRAKQDKDSSGQPPQA